MSESIVEHAGYRIRIRSCGPASGPHAVLLPGMGATAAALAPQARALRVLGYTTHVVELPGFGLAPALRKSDARFSQLADLVLEVVGRLGVERAVFLGHSLGGGIALQIALRRPAAVAGLVLIAPAGLGRSMLWAYKLYCVPLIGRALLRPYDRGTRAHLRRFLIGRARRDDDRFIAHLLRRDRRSAATTRSIRAIVWANQPPRWRRLLLLPFPGGEQLGYTLHGRVAALRDIPTLVLWGTDDRVFSARDAAAFRLANPTAEVHVARDIGHMLPLEAAAWANEHIAWFDALHLRQRPRAA
ncbi:MAG TPA: alpha/beta fold hydrolase [Candidatus Limnocylindria bacterium]|jgi:pimeloyl-ACP methyl ester carboxylesterase|nr:alpha/beta fold hydrolase [Candidatus Limnocylindria bacterium]